MQQLPTRKHVLNTLFEKWAPEIKTELISIDKALGRVLARDYGAVYSFPVVRSSGMDGVAVSSERFKNGIPDTSGWEIGVDFCRADTGDDFDDRFDAAIPIEDVDISPDNRLTIKPYVKVTPNMNVRPVGDMIKKGEAVGIKNRRLRSFDIACLAMGGITEVEVYRKPKVAFIPSGSELIPLGETPQRGTNIDSNSILVKNMLTEMGAEPIIYPIVRDNRSELKSSLEKALLTADAVILSGGSSKGEEDFSARILEESGAALFHWVAAAPGKPMCIALMDNKPVINIPGPPVAMFYGTDWCTRSIVYRMLNLPMPFPQTISAPLTEPIVAPPGMEILCFMELERSDKGWKTHQKTWRKTTMADNLGAGAIYITPLDKGIKEPGDIIEVTLLRGEEDF